MTEPTTIKFGTDGWRAIIARDFTFEHVRACAEGVCRLLKAQGLDGQGIVVGYDSRFASREFAEEVAQVSAANGIRTYLCQAVTPTPVVSFNILHRGAGGGVVITASHNPGSYNGFKYKPDYAGSAAPEIVVELEEHIAAAQTTTIETIGIGEARRTKMLVDVDAAEPYLANVKRAIDLDAIRDSGLRVLVDNMHGAGSGYLARLLDGGSSGVTELRADVNPAFPGMRQPEPIEHNLEPSIGMMRSGNFDVCVATDGDADRLGLLDERGRFITTLHTFSLLALHQLEIRQERGPLVKSLTQSAMIDRLGARYAVPVHTTAVGFKYLGPVMMKVDALAAGEESGGYAFRGNIPERDGIFSALLFLELMVRTGKKASELVDWLYELAGAPHYYDRLDVQLAAGAQPPLAAELASRAPGTLAGLRVQRTDTTDGARFVLDDGFWCLVRPSGTEPLIRIYAEADSPNRVQRLLQELRQFAGA